MRSLKAKGCMSGMNDKNWDDKAGWLKAIRAGWFNEDYIGFLVDRVWKIKDPVNILDFGCGLGYVGTILLPVLPAGSTYTGIDISDNLLNEAKIIFKDTVYKTEFIQADLNEYIPESKYDIATSQAVLRHIPNAENILKNMIGSVIDDGLVICMETDMEMGRSGLYFNGFDHTELGMDILQRKIWKKEKSDGGRDYRFASKIPILMQEFGLRDIGVRVSDNVYFLNPDGGRKEYARQYQALTNAWGWNEELHDDEKEAYVELLMNKGLNKEEALAYFTGDQKIREYVVKNMDNASIIKALCTLIAYGTK
jgi:SAM-dependent methyltransferase